LTSDDREPQHKGILTDEELSQQKARILGI
jgi:hypothetical protein